METPATSTHPKFVRWALMLGIVVILNIFFNVILSLTYPTPKYEDYCPVVQPGVNVTDAATCNSLGGVWNETNVPVPLSESAPMKPASVGGYCDLYAKCLKSYQAVNDQHALYAFIVMVSLGIVALVAGFMPIGSSIVSSGLSYGGVVALIVGSAQYWGNAGNWIRLAISTAGLIALLYIGWRRFRD